MSRKLKSINTFRLGSSVLFAALLLMMLSCNTQTKKPVADEEPSTGNRIAKWQEHKFSMFIHWGLYSIPAGEWNGKQIQGYSEQIKAHAKISSADYSKLAPQFNPVHWNSDSVALLAKRAGMRSIVITSKHHDGFSMFGTKYSKFNVVDATPFKRDVVKELSQSCKRYGLDFGVYFSLIDWDYPGATPFVSARNSDTIPEAHHQYNLHQVEELLTNYGPISEIWFDMGSPTYKQSKEIAQLVKRLQPNCMISGRLWNDQGDFAVMGDNTQPDFKMGVPWQTPASMFHETWSYRSWQKRGDVKAKVAEKIHDLLNVISMGGNYLLNIGPKGDGSVVPFEKQVLTGMGEWLNKNGESVYGTTVSLLDEQEWGVITSKPGKLYLQIMNYPKDNKLVLRGVNAEVKKIYPLSNKGLLLRGDKADGNLVIDLTDQLKRDDYSTVIVVEYVDKLSFTPKNSVKASEDGHFELTAANAQKYHSFSGHDYYSTKPTVVKLQWSLINEGNKKCEIEVADEIADSDADASGAHNDKLCMVVNGTDYLISLNNTRKSSTGVVYYTKINNVTLKTNQINNIEIKLNNQTNPHKGMAVEAIKVIVK